MSDYEEVVKGRIVAKQTGAPVAGAVVEVYDKDLLVDDYLGTAVTDNDGRFEVDFTWAEYRAGAFENRPDIYLMVRDPATGRTAKSKVYEELSGELADDDSVEVMDLGDVPVS